MKNINAEKTALLRWSNAVEAEIAPNVDAFGAGHVDYDYWVRPIAGDQGHYLTDEEVLEFKKWMEDNQ